MATTKKLPPPEHDVNEKVISKETSKRVCDHMNDDHTVSVYAMGKHTGPKLEAGWKMTGAILKNVTMNGATIQVIRCRGDACQQNEVIYPFVPPLSEPHQIRSRMVMIHHQVCGSPISCYNHTLFPAVVVFFIISSYYGLQMDGPNSDPTLRKGMHDCFYLLLMAHTVMAIYGTYLCHGILKLKRRGMMNWFVAIFVSGWLGMKELLELVDIVEKSKAVQTAAAEKLS